MIHNIVPHYAYISKRNIISLEVANKSFLKFSAWLNFADLPSNFESLVTPSTRWEISFPKFTFISLRSVFVSSTTSWSKAVMIVFESNL